MTISFSESFLLNKRLNILAGPAFGHPGNPQNQTHNMAFNAHIPPSPNLPVPVLVRPRLLDDYFPMSDISDSSIDSDQEELVELIQNAQVENEVFYKSLLMIFKDFCL